MSDFKDPELEQLLGRAAGNYPDVNVGYERLQGRVRQARRRRAVVWSGAACSLLFATALIAAQRNGDSAPTQLGDRETLDATFPDETTNDTTHDTTDDTSPDTAHDTTHDSSVPETDRTGNSPRNTSATTTPGNGNGSNPTSSAPTTTVAPASTSVFSGEGGSITVRLQGGALTLISQSAIDGFSIDVQHSAGDRVEVRFESSNHRTRIRIDLKDGAVVPSIEENAT
ncbi:MAG: hypothetical protein K8R99_00370 [Actinomycetia bacterium]|nr:hypothetical protein [Actinomycetes bacterium]